MARSMSAFVSCFSSPFGPTISSVVLPLSNSSNADSSFVFPSMRSPIFAENAAYTKFRKPSVACPQHCRVFRRQIAAQQVMSVAVLCFLQLALVHVEGERLTSHRFGRQRHPNLDKAKCPTRLLLGRPDAQQQLISTWQAASHGAQLAQQPCQAFAPHGPLFGLPPITPRQHIQLTLVLVQLHLHALAHLLPRQIQPLFLVLVDHAFGCFY